ncbi:MAG: prephenate dehydratase domain-containing protein [Acetivibrio sp.]
MLDLNTTRDNIDKIDCDIVKLFEARMELTKEVAEYKTKTGKAILDREREKSKLAALQNLVQNEYNRYPVQELFTQIMSMSRKYQYRLVPSYSGDLSFSLIDSLELTESSQIVCFGEPGSYTEQAAQNFFGLHVSCFHSNSFKEIMEKVQSGEMDYGVLPIENSSTGGILDTYDLLLSYNNFIIGEHVLKIDHALVGLEGSSLSELKSVYSHPQALLQCAGFFETHPNILPHEFFSTSASAKKILEDGDKTQAAIAGKCAALEYGLNVLEDHLNFENSNATRFIIITNKKQYLSYADKVSICFELPHESGTLYTMLSHFIYNHLNMTKIESRPILGRPWEYRFFVDFQGNLKESGVKNAINGIKEEAADLKILGNFSTQ